MLLFIIHTYIMDYQDKNLTKSGGRRLPFYAEIGGYFYPNGELNETAFRETIKKAFAQFQENKDNTHYSSPGEWFSAYLDTILMYLEEKNMTRILPALFEIAVDEAATLGIENINIPTVHLKHFVSNIKNTSNLSNLKKRTDEEKRRTIFDAAIQVFAEHGYHSATTDQIAQLASISKGTLYRLFKSKEDLLEQLLEEKNQEIVEQFSEIFSSGDNIVDQIETAIIFHVKFIERNHILYRLIQNEGIAKKGSSRSVVFYDYLVSHLPMLKEKIVSLNQKGRLKTTSFYTAWYGILGFIDGVAYKWFRSEMSYSLSDELPYILEIIFNGVIGEGTTGRKYFIPPEDIADDK